MININLPPFYIGQRVVALKDSNNGKFKKGGSYVVLGVDRCKCGSWSIDIGAKVTYPTQECYCGKICSYEGGVRWCRAICFAPIESQFAEITFKECIAIESSVTCMQ